MDPTKDKDQLSLKSDWWPNENQLEDLEECKYANDSEKSVIMDMQQKNIYDLRPADENDFSGYCLIMNQMKDREGSEYDVYCLQALFKKQFRMKTEILFDSSLDELAEKMDQFSNFSYRSVVIILMAHGRGDELLMGDGQYMNLNYHVLNKLDKTESLVGIPKLVFLQACEGNEGPPSPLPTDNSNPGVFLSSLHNAEAPSISARSRRMADLLCFRATQIPIGALRHPEYGTLFIQAVCEIFKRHAHCKDLGYMCATVSALMARTEKNDISHLARISFSTLEPFYFYSTGQQKQQNKEEKSITQKKIVPLLNSAVAQVGSSPVVQNIIEHVKMELFGSDHKPLFGSKIAGTTPTVPKTTDTQSTGH